LCPSEKELQERHSIIKIPLYLADVTMDSKALTSLKDKKDVKAVM
jgi:hypothetical protein